MPSLARVLLALPILALVACSGSTAGVGSSGSSGATKDPGPEPGPERAGSGPRDLPKVTFTGEGAGCGDVFAYRASSDGTQYVTVSVDTKSLGLAVGQKSSIDLSRAGGGVKVAVDVYETVPLGETYCTDLGEPNRPAKTTWEAEAGTLTIELEPDAARPSSEANAPYRATIRLDDLHVTGPERGAAAIVPSVTIERVLVGWYPG